MLFSNRKYKKGIKKKPLIGFSAAPWTLATYFIEGSITKDLSKIKSYSYKYPKEMDFIIDLFSNLISQHLLNQINAGIDLIQIFDTHSYQMDYKMHKKYSTDQIKKISHLIKKNILIYQLFIIKKNCHFLEKDLSKYIDCLSLNSNVSLKDKIEYFKSNMMFQGNLDPIY